MLYLGSINRIILNGINIDMNTSKLVFSIS